MADQNKKTNTSPLIISIITAFSGLIGTGIGATVISSFADQQLERQKFEYTLIQEALEAESQDEVLANLEFLLAMDMIQTLDEKKLEELSQKPEHLERLRNLPKGLGLQDTQPLQSTSSETIETASSTETVPTRPIRN